MFFKKKKKDLKIQDVSADCPDYALSDGKEEVEKSRKKTKKKKMRKIREKKRNPLLVILWILLFAAAAGAFVYFVGIPYLSDYATVYVERVSNIMGLGSGNGTLNRYAGIVESQGEWSVVADADKTIKEVYVNAGDEVETGDALFAYDKEELELNLQQAKLELERLESELEAANLQISSLTEEKADASSSEELEIEIQIQSLKANNKKTEYEIKNQNAQVEKLEDAVENVVVVSELSGVVKNVDQTVVNGSAFGETEFITILAAGDYRIKGTINEQNQWSVEEGMKVIIRSRVDSDITWTGTILTIQTDEPEQIDNQVSNNSSELNASSNYPFYVQLDSSEGLLLGQHVYVEPDKGQDTEKEGVWLEGYYLVQEENQTFVWVQGRFNLLEKREVKLGTFDEDLGQYEILSGLDKNDYIAFPTENMRSGLLTTVEAGADEMDESSSGNKENSLEMDDDIFQEFEENNENGGDSEEMGPVGSIDSASEVLL